MCFSCLDCRYWRQETVVATPWGPQKRSQICTLRAQADLEQLGPDHAGLCPFYSPTKQSMEENGGKSMTIQELLEGLSRNEQRARELADMRRAILANLESAIPPGDAVTFAGYQAQWKPGRRTTDHEAAAAAVTVDPAIVEKHSTVKTTVAWAKVTKDAKIPKSVLDQFTTEAPPSFSVEPMK